MPHAAIPTAVLARGRNSGLIIDIRQPSGRIQATGGTLRGGWSATLVQNDGDVPMIHVDIDEHRGVISLDIDAALSSANVRQLSERASAHAARSAPLHGLIIRAAQMPPWRDLSTFLNNLRVIGEHKPDITRVAVMTDSPPVSYVAHLVAFFPQAELDSFTMRARERALAWVSGAVATTGAIAAGADPQTDADMLETDPSESVPELEPVGVVEIDELPEEGGEEDSWFV